MTKAGASKKKVADKAAIEGFVPPEAPPFEVRSNDEIHQLHKEFSLMQQQTGGIPVSIAGSAVLKWVKGEMSHQELGQIMGEMVKLELVAFAAAERYAAEQQEQTPAQKLALPGTGKLIVPGRNQRQ